MRKPRHLEPDSSSAPSPEGGAQLALCLPLCTPLCQEAVLPDGRQLSAHSWLCAVREEGPGRHPGRTLCSTVSPLQWLTPVLLWLHASVLVLRPNGITLTLTPSCSDVRSFSVLSCPKILSCMFAYVNFFIYVANIYYAPTMSSVLVTKWCGQSLTLGDFAPM